MTKGQIEVGFDDGMHILRFSGDVRMNLCVTLDRYLNDVLLQKSYRHVVIDLASAEGLDSTTLGQIAKISIMSRKHCGITPTIYSPNNSITRILLSMGFDQVFDIINQEFSCHARFEKWVGETVQEDIARTHVMEAHRVLMGLNDNNKIMFKDLMESLEHDCSHDH